MAIDHVFVAGAGLMGHGIGQVHAAIGKQVMLYEPDASRAEAGKARIAGNLDRAVAKGKLSTEERDAILARVATSSDLQTARTADLVIEAVFEDSDVKRALWSKVDEVAPERTIFASNTSSISIDALAEAVSPARRERFVGMHFFSPVPVMPLVELIRGSATTDETEGAIRELSEALGKKLIVSADRPGFIVNRLLVPYLLDAIRSYEHGLGTLEDIDKGMQLGCGYPMGPFTLLDFVGLDTTYYIANIMFDEYREPAYAPPPLLKRMVLAGRLGRKSGQGFYKYS